MQENGSTGCQHPPNLGHSTLYKRILRETEVVQPKYYNQNSGRKKANHHPNPMAYQWSQTSTLTTREPDRSITSLSDIANLERLLLQTALRQWRIKQIPNQAQSHTSNWKIGLKALSPSHMTGESPTPPTNGLTTDAMPKAAPNRPWTIPRLPIVTISEIIINTITCIPPPPTPANTRPPISMFILLARAHTKLPASNKTMAIATTMVYYRRIGIFWTNPWQALRSAT
ncbi:hypothetical protein TRICI_000370 [Trichomonascus ciferrii]|uniref:Uncharacterized protein n=1 Tax=Trichomonascus ciferrii TaxID=44093 RepID=A0A642VDP6_9ASCO|nr:hypothetical protein TRICI_000370 [Trichomonascus ciferrii]